MSRFGHHFRMKSLLVIFMLVFLAVMLLGIRVFFLNRKFPNIHIGGNKALKKRGIGCYSSQDREEQKKVTKK